MGERRGGDRMNDEFRKKSRTEGLKALVFEFCSLLLQATVPSCPVEKSIRIWEFVPKCCWKAWQNFLELWPLKKKRQNLVTVETRYRVTWKHGKCNDWGGGLVTDISTDQIGSDRPADFTSWRRVFFVRVCYGTKYLVHAQLLPQERRLCNASMLSKH